MSSKHIKYTKELLQEAVDNSTSFAGVIRYLGLRQAGGTQTHIAKKIRQFDIDTNHFLGMGWNRGGTDPKRKNPSQILIVLPEGSFRPKRNQLLRAMLESGVDYTCSTCYNSGVWNGKDLVLEIDHIDGNFLNNQLNNLRFMCPNCHSQQDTNKPNRYAPA
jgi:hypothetical protein